MKYKEHPVTYFKVITKCIRLFNYQRDCNRLTSANQNVLKQCINVPFKLQGLVVEWGGEREGMVGNGGTSTLGRPGMVGNVGLGTSGK